MKKVVVLIGNENIVDVYCGVGIIGFWFVNDVVEVCGMDVILEVIVDVRKNVKCYGFINMKYEVGKVE